MLSVPCCPYHFVQYHLVRSQLRLVTSPHHAIGPNALNVTPYEYRYLTKHKNRWSVASLLIVKCILNAGSGTTVVIWLPIEKQTKESVRHDVIYCVGLGHMFLLLGCGPYVSIVWLWTICFYYVALGHMFLLCVCMCIYVCVCVYVYVCVYVCVCVCVYVCVSMYVHAFACKLETSWPYPQLVFVHVWVCVCMYACMDACMYACIYVCMYDCTYVCVWAWNRLTIHD